MKIDEILQHIKKMCAGIKRDKNEPDKVLIMADKIMFDVQKIEILKRNEDNELSPEQVRELANMKAEVEQLKKAIKMLANVLNETDYCTHYPGYTCDRDFPAECPECIIEYFMQQAGGTT